MIDKNYFNILDEDNNVIKTDIYEHHKWVTNNKGREDIGKDTIEEYFISTVLLPISLDKPFESMVLCKDEELNEYQERYNTYEEAVKGHQQIMNKVLSRIVNRHFDENNTDNKSPTGSNNQG